MEHLHSSTAGSWSHSELEDLAYSLFTTLFPYRELQNIVHVPTVMLQLSSCASLWPPKTTCYVLPCDKVPLEYVRQHHDMTVTQSNIFNPFRLSMRERRHLREHPGPLSLRLRPRLHRHAVRGQRQRVRLQPVPEQGHLPRPARGLQVHLHAR